jgi:hypothetical protein
MRNLNAESTATEPIGARIVRSWRCHPRTWRQHWKRQHWKASSVSELLGCEPRARQDSNLQPLDA